MRRARTPQAQVDAILRCAEVVARYLAAVCLASLCAREDAGIAPTEKLATFTGKLGFGSFLYAIDEAHAGDQAHPLRTMLIEGWRGQRPLPEQASYALDQLRLIRNEIGHGLANLSEVRANQILTEKMPDKLLVTALTRLDAVLSLPLFVVESHEIEQRRPIAQYVLLMGDSADPLPVAIELPLEALGLPEKGQPQIGFPGGVLNLEPFLIWHDAPKKGNRALYLLQEIESAEVVYQSVSDDSAKRGPNAVREITRRLVAGDCVPYETVAPKNSQSFHALWQGQRQLVEQEAPSLVVWDDFDQATLRWYGRKLGAADTSEAIRAEIRTKLLDSREFLHNSELRQLHLLFGHEATVQRLVGRAVIDCRQPIKDDLDKRFERVEVTHNTIKCLGEAVDFFTRHLQVAGANIDALTATSGTANYIAMREALVNLLIHQDYTDQRMPGQVILEKDRATFINAGAALVSNSDLIEGGVNQSRNPLLSRALKLIKFAELAGSGLGSIYTAWREARRLPPTVQSDAAKNYFRLTLDWRTLPSVADSFWKTATGIALTPTEAATVLLAAEPKGTTIEAIAIAHGMRLEDVGIMLQKLSVNELIVEQGGKIMVHEKQRARVQQARDQHTG